MRTAAIACLALLAAAPAARAQTEEQLRSFLVSTNPEVRVDGVDQEILRVRRIDVVDADGVIRMTLAGNVPNPVMDGVEWRRSTSVSGIMMRDEQGNERGGFGWSDRNDGVVFALDHVNGEAAGFNVLPDGTVNLVMQARQATVPSPIVNGRLLPALQSRTPFQVTVGTDGVPIISLKDNDDHVRLRLTVTEEGYGAIQFLNAEGNVVSEIVPERTP
jgi:hypothetical protein